MKRCLWVFKLKHGMHIRSLVLTWNGGHNKPFWGYRPTAVPSTCTRIHYPYPTHTNSFSEELFRFWEGWNGSYFSRAGEQDWNNLILLSLQCLLVLNHSVELGANFICLYSWCTVGGLLFSSHTFLWFKQCMVSSGNFFQSTLCLVLGA